MRFLLIVFFLGIFACKPQDDISNAPKIEFVSISPDQVTEWQDSITIVVKYTDGDSDLGENDANVQNLFIKDNRINITYGFRIKQLAPLNAQVPITGQLEVILPNTGITDNLKMSETVNYEIYVKDRAGNESNRTTTTDILIVGQ